MSKHASVQEIFMAYLALSKSDQIVLRKAAQKLGDGTSFYEADDLIHESLNRTIEGRRNWPTDINFLLFMCQTMRSVAYADRSRMENKGGFTITIEQYVELEISAQSSYQSAEDHLLSKETLLAAANAVDMARSSLRDDPQATQVLNGMVSGLSASETCESCALNLRDFRAARQRAVRRLSAARLTHASTGNREKKPARQSCTPSLR